MAAEPEMIGPSVLQEPEDNIAEGLVLRYSESIENGEVPKNLREDNIMPIFKKLAK